MKNRKWIIIIVAIVLLVGVAAYLIGSGGFKSDDERRKEVLAPKIEGIGSTPPISYVKAPSVEGKLEVVSIGKPSKEMWERVATARFNIKVKNISSSYLAQVAITHRLTFEGGQVFGWDSGSMLQGLNPGEEKTTTLEYMSIQYKITKIEISFGNPIFAGGGPTSTPKLSPAPKSTLTPTPTPDPSAPKASSKPTVTYTASNYPKNPVEPGEVVAAFYFFVMEKRYLDAARLIEKLEAVVAMGNLDEIEIRGKKISPRFDEIRTYKGGIKNIRVDRSSISDSENTRVSITALCNNGSSVSTTQSLIRENQKWKLVQRDF